MRIICIDLKIGGTDFMFSFSMRAVFTLFILQLFFTSAFAVPHGSHGPTQNTQASLNPLVKKFASLRYQCRELGLADEAKEFLSDAYELAEEALHMKPDDFA